MDKTILTLAAIIILLGGIAAFVTLRGSSNEPVDSTDDIEIVFGDETVNTPTGSAEKDPEEETETTDTETTTDEDEESSEEEETAEETDSESEEDTTEDETEDEESEEEDTEETETEETTETEEVVHTSEDDWDTIFEYTTEDTEEVYRVRFDDEPTTNTDGESVRKAVIEYAEAADESYATIESFTVSPVGSTTFSMDDAGYSFLTLTKNGPKSGQYFLINKNGQNVYPLMQSSTYYYVYGGLGGKIFVVQSQVSGDGGVYLNYYNDEKVECALYTEQPVQGDSIEVVANEIVFTIDENAEENAGEEVTLDFVEVCEL